MDIDNKLPRLVFNPPPSARGRSAIECGGLARSYGELVDRSNSFAMELLDGRADLFEERVAIAAPPGFDFAVLLWAVWKAGGIAVPLNVHSTDVEIGYCIKTASIQKLVGTENLCARFKSLCTGLNVDIQALPSIDVRSSQPSSRLPDITIERRALMIFTSGTTSQPKGVVTTHRNVLAQVEALVTAWKWTEEDRIPLFLPLHHVHGLINVLSCALYIGARVEAFTDGFEVDAILLGALEERWTLFMAVPTVYVKIIDAIESLDSMDKAEKVCMGFGSLRLMISGSAALPASIHARWRELTGQRLLERYGMTEIGMALSNPLVGERRPGFVGLPLPGVNIRLALDDGTIATHESGVEGVLGEIQVKGENVFLEYWNDAAATKAAFSRDRWFSTGDMALREAAYYRIMGRISIDIIKSGGYKLSALEVESVLLEHPKILECAVIGIQDDVWGEQVAAIVVLGKNSRLTLIELNEWAKERLSSYKLPRYLRIIDELPRNVMGKVVKSKLKAMLDQPW